MSKGLIHIYCGDGKGKTTAALGLSVRAAGDGYNVIIVQFLKSWNTSELTALKSLNNITVIRGQLPSGFSWQLNEEEKLQVTNEHNRIFAKAVSLCDEGQKTLLVFDELVGTLDINLIDRQLVLDFLNNKPEQLEIVMTGRNPDIALLNLADYVSEIKKIKHPMDNGVKARKGIEF